MEKIKEIRLKLSEKNWRRAKKRAEETGISLSAWIAAKVDEILNEEEALMKISASNEKSFASDFPSLYAGLSEKLKLGRKTEAGIKPALDRVKEKSDSYLHSEKIEKASKNMLKKIKSLEPSMERLKNASKNSIHSETWDNTSKKFHEELKSLKPTIERLKKASRDYLHSEPAEKASKQFSEQMKAVEKALKKLMENER